MDGERPLTGLYRAGILAAILSAVIAGCSLLGPATLAIPTTPTTPPGQPAVCELALHLPFRLAGDPSKTPPVWGVGQDGQVFSIAWPGGFRARFSPQLQVLDPAGTVVARGGELIDDAGGGSGTADFDLCSLGGRSY